MASKFFAAADSDHSGSEDNKSEASAKDKPVVKKQAYFDSSSDEDVVRVVRSEKDKRYEAIRNVISKIKDKMRIKDFVSIENEFDNLNKEYEKAKKVVEKEGVPIFYTRICYVIEQFINNVTPEEKKALKPANNKAFNVLKQKIRKNNKLIEDKIKQFSEHPVFSDEEVVDEDNTLVPGAKIEGKKESDDDSYWDKEDESDDGKDDDPDDIKKYLLSSDPQVRRNYWLKRDTGKTELTEEEKKKEEEEKKKRDEERRRKKKKDFDETVFDKPKKTKQAFKLDEMDKRIKDIVERRSGKKPSTKEKRISLDDDLEALEDFFEISKGNHINRLEVILHLMPARQEVSRQISQYFMPRAYFLQNFENLKEYFKIIRDNYRGLSEVRTFQKDGDIYYKENSIYESYATHFEGMDAELQKAFRAIENSSLEYSERLRDYANMIKLCSDSINFFRQVGDDFHETKFAFKKIEYTYYLSDKLYTKLNSSASERSIKTENEFYTDANSQNTVQELANKIYKSTDSKLIMKTLLYQVYNHAVNGRYHVAKDLFLMSHIADYAQALDPNNQVLYNRVLVQLGVCAFSLGLLQEAINCLNEIISSQRLKELIGQGLSKNPLNEKEERRRMVPYHMFINTDLVETVHTIAAMLVEVPNIVAEQYDATKKQGPKQFRRIFENYKNIYGPPETSKDIVMAAGKALQQGNWKGCYDYLAALNVWNKLSQDCASAKQHLLNKVKEQAFKCYIFVYQNNYDSVDIDHLANKFEITKDYIHSFVSKLVFSQELKAYLDVDSNCLMFERDGNTKIEHLALQLSEKISNFLTSSERIMDSKYGNYGFSDKDIGEKIVSKKQNTKKKIFNVTKDKNKKKTKKN